MLRPDPERLALGSAGTWVSWLALGLLVHHWTQAHPRTPALAQTAAILAFAWCQSALVTRALRGPLVKEPDSDAPPIHFAVLLFALVWGRHSFLQNFHHDELGYFGSVGQNLHQAFWSLFEPLNEHFLPVTKLLQWAVYNAFGIDYFGIAAVHCLVFTVLLHAFWLLLTELGAPPFARSLATAWLAIWPSFADDHLWKGAGLNLFLSAAAFFLWLTLSIRALDGKIELERRSISASVILCAITIFSSSLITLPAIYLATLLPVHRRAWRKLAFVASESIALSAAYFVCRRWLAGVALPTRSPPGFRELVDVAGSFVGKNLFDWNPAAATLPILAAAVIAAPVVAIVVMRQRALARGSGARFIEPAAALGLGIFLISIVQLWVGRGFDVRTGPTSRHNFFPAVGLAIYFSGLLAAFRGSFPTAAIRIPRAAGRVVVAVGLVAAAVLQQRRIQRAFPVEQQIALRESRRQFFDSLEKVLCEARRISDDGSFRRFDLPDLPLEQCREGCDLGITPPFNLAQYGFTLSYYAQAADSRCFDRVRLRFVPPAALADRYRQRLLSSAEARQFFQRYFLEFGQ
jgi:hypothetical protein